MDTVVTFLVPLSVGNFLTIQPRDIFCFQEQHQNIRCVVLKALLLLGIRCFESLSESFVKGTNHRVT